MAIVNAVASGNYSNYAVTFGGVVPQPGDTVRAGNFIITIDIAADSIQFERTGTGYYQINQNGVNNNNGLLDLASCDFVDVSGGTRDGSLRLSHTTGTVSIRDVTNIHSAGTVYTVICSAGDFMCRDVSVGRGSSRGIVTSSGLVQCRSVLPSSLGGTVGIYHSGSGVLRVQNVYPGQGNGVAGGASHGILHVGSGVTEVENAFGGSVIPLNDGGGNAIRIESGSGTVRVENAYAGDLSGFPAVANISGSTAAIVENVYGNSYGPGGGTRVSYAISGSNNTQYIKVKRLIFGPYGAIPVSGTVFIDDSLDNSVQLRLSSNGPTKTLVDSNLLNNVPNISDVRSGTSYSNGDNVGTCGVPLPEQVAFGIPVDDTVGTAVLLPSVLPTAAEISDFVHSDDLRDYELDPHTIAEALNIISKSIGAT